MQPAGDPPDRQVSVRPISLGFSSLEDLLSRAAFVRNSVPAPASQRPTDEEFFSLEDSTKPNVEFLRRHFLREGRVTEDQALFIISKASELLRSEPNVLELKSPINICGDIHGQYYDLNRLFREGGSPEKKSYLFLGDYVDRGYFSIECVLYLWALKICYPATFFLLRGNHECRHLSTYFTFKLECQRKYSTRIYNACIESFCALPLAAVVDKKFFCVHGGLSPLLPTLADIQRIDRFCEPPKDGGMCDLLWSDPHPSFGVDPRQKWFLHNHARGCSYYFTHHAVRNFLATNDLLCVVRAHEAQQEGLRLYPDTEGGVFPLLISVFSAPNYLDMHRNKAAILALEDGKLTFLRFPETEHPFWLPNFIDAFTWSMPFLASKVNDMLRVLLSDEELRELKRIDDELRERSGIIRKKIMAVARWARIYALLREETERASEFKTVLGATNLPFDKLSVAVEHTKAAITSFDDACKSDVENERLPPPLIDDPMDVDTVPASFMPTSGDAPVNQHGAIFCVGTTDTSPSTRRRSVETTMKLMKEICDE